MSNRVRVGLIAAVIVLAFLMPGASAGLRWSPYLGFTILTFFAALELHRALARRLPGLSFIPWILALLAALTPGLVRIWYPDHTFWHNLPLGRALPSEFLLNNAWLTNFVWLAGIGVALYALVFVLVQSVYGVLRLLREGPEVLPVLGVQIAAALTLSLPLACVGLFLYSVPNGFRWLLYAFLIASSTDIVAYYVGSKMGRKRIVPEISPNKTVEGFLGGLLFSALISALYFHFFLRGGAPQMDAAVPNLFFGIVLGLVVSLASQVHDWLASAVKRWSEIKDYSRILGDHGGILDRCDSIMGAIPWTFIGALIYYFIER